MELQPAANAGLQQQHLQPIGCCGQRVDVEEERGGDGAGAVSAAEWAERCALLEYQRDGIAGNVREANHRVTALKAANGKLEARLRWYKTSFASEHNRLLQLQAETGKKSEEDEEKRAQMEQQLAELQQRVDALSGERDETRAALAAAQLTCEAQAEENAKLIEELAASLEMRGKLNEIVDELESGRAALHVWCLAELRRAGAENARLARALRDARAERYSMGADMEISTPPRPPAPPPPPPLAPPSTTTSALSSECFLPVPVPVPAAAPPPPASSSSKPSSFSALQLGAAVLPTVALVVRPSLGGYSTPQHNQ